MSEFLKEITEESNDDTDVAHQVYAITKGGKEIVIYNDLHYWKVKLRPGGEMPSRLTGRFTSYKVAAEAVDNYLAHQPTPKRKTTSKTATKNK